jgi:hypothetical protein
MADILAWLTARAGEIRAIFAEHEIDVEILPLLSEDDVRELDAAGSAPQIVGGIGDLRSGARRRRATKPNGAKLR